MKALAQKSLRESLIEAHRQGQLLVAAYQESIAGRGKRGDVAAELISLHNAGVIDVVDAFSALGATEAGPEFFLTRHVFKAALPEIRAPVLPVMRCVVDLWRRAGNDLMAGSIVNSFISFCAKDSARPREALDAAKTDLGLLDLLTGSIVAGALVSLEEFVGEAAQLLKDSDAAIRRRAAFALGRIRWPDDATPPEHLYVALETATQQDSDDEVLGSVAKAAFALFVQDKRQEGRVAKLIDNALSHNGDLAVHAASEIAAQHAQELTPEIADVLIPHLLMVKPAHKGTLDNIDHYLSHLVRRGDAAKAIGVVETLLLAHAEILQLNHFDSLTAEIRKDRTLLGTLITRWFICGDRVLCEGVAKVISAEFGRAAPIDVDATELAPFSYSRALFVARKAIGYLFWSPIHAASIIVSLMRQTEDAETLEALSDHLFDPLLISYPGEARDYVAAIAKGCNGAPRRWLKRSVRRVDQYIECLRSVGAVPEFTPSIAQREASTRLSARQMAESMKAAEARSPFLSIVQKSVLLYGRRSINYIYGSSGESHRTEVPLKSHSVQFEIPRASQLDPFGIEHMLLVFRAERLRQ